jgi:protein-S-isoprenylcysteine O-methyltransferase Ste14
LDLFLDIVVTAFGLMVFAQHVWALRGHFVSRTMNPGAYLIAVTANLVLVAYLVLVWTGAQPPLAQVAGLVLEGLSLWLFWGAVGASRAARLRFIFDADGPETLVRTGPYARVRHPFYASYLIYWAGWALACWSVWGLVPLVVVIVLYARAALFEERLFAGTAMAAAYAEYRRRAGLFWPRF